MELRDAVEILGDVARGSWNSRQDVAAQVVLAALSELEDVESQRVDAARLWRDAAVRCSHAERERDEAQARVDELAERCARKDLELDELRAR